MAIFSGRSGAAGRGNLKSEKRSVMKRFNAGKFTGLGSTRSRVQVAVHGWVQMRPQTEGSGLSRTITWSASAKRPCAMKSYISLARFDGWDIRPRREKSRDAK